MATEITCVSAHPLHPDHIERVGGPGWSADVATVLLQISEGREFYLRRGDVLLRVCRATRFGRETIATDPAETADNLLLALPDCRAVAGLTRARRS